MRARAAIINAVNEKWVVEDVTVGEPGPDEVLVQVAASGLCHSDDHFVTGDLGATLPLVGGHEGAGTVVSVGSRVTRVAPGDRVSTLFIPACGRCRYCSRGQQYLCDNGAGMETGLAMDGTHRFFRADGSGVGATCRLGTFSNYLVCHETQAVKLPDDIPFDLACLVSCGVATGWGAAVNGGDIRPGDVVLVVGMGGVGANAVQGARHAGADHVLVVDPVAFKRDMAPTFGATETFASIDEARPRIAALTNGQGVDVAIVAVGRVDGEIVGAAFDAVGKAGTCVILAVGSSERHIAASPQDFTNLAKTLRGVMYGLCNPNADIPRLIGMYRSGRLKLDELVTRRYSLDEVNDAYADMHEGRNIRGVIVHEH